MLALAFLTTAALAADPNVPHEHKGIVAAYSGAPPAGTLAADELAKLAAGEMVLKQVRTGNGGRRHLAKRWGVNAATDLIDAVAASVTQFTTTAEERKVPPSNIAEIGADVARRAEQLQS